MSGSACEAPEPEVEGTVRRASEEDDGLTDRRLAELLADEASASGALAELPAEARTLVDRGAADELWGRRMRARWALRNEGLIPDLWVASGREAVMIREGFPEPDLVRVRRAAVEVAPDHWQPERIATFSESIVRYRASVPRRLLRWLWGPLGALTIVLAGWAAVVLNPAVGDWISGSLTLAFLWLIPYVATLPGLLMVRRAAILERRA